MKTYGLIGKNISYSFSRNYFTEKFGKLGMHDCQYLNFDLNSIESFPAILREDVKGLNVTIPYKEQIMPFLDAIDNEARTIGAVNTIKISEGILTGYNTDAIGFEKALMPFLKTFHKKALVLGTGGASKAVKYVLEKLGIAVSMVSRHPQENIIGYDTIDRDCMNSHLLIVNCTPLGTFPGVEAHPEIPYQYISSRHILFDLIYNPTETTFLRKGSEQGAKTVNGLKMLEFQAEAAWRIWNM